VQKISFLLLLTKHFYNGIYIVETNTNPLLGEGRDCEEKMLFIPNNPLWIHNNIYKQLLDPCTYTVPSEYFIPIFKNLIEYYKEFENNFTVAILHLKNLPNLKKSEQKTKDTILLAKTLTSIRSMLRPLDMIFYNGKQEVLFLFPNTNKQNTKILLNRIRTDLERINNTKLKIKGGFAEFPVDSANLIKLRKYALKALKESHNFKENKIIGYFHEKRLYPRKPIQIETRYETNENIEHIACSRNISEGGMLISCLPNVAFNNNIRVSFKIPRVHSNKITVTAKKIWSKLHKKSGTIDVGLCFIKVGASAKQKIKYYMLNNFPPIVSL